jgi:hypothetical protein
MQCPRCGDSNYDSDRFCSSCGHDLATYRRLWIAADPQSAAAPDTQAIATALVGAAPRTAAPTLQSTQAVEVAPTVPDYSTWAAALLALCWPAFWAAIPALVHAGRAKSMLADGDLPGAQNASRRAKDWCWVTFIAGSVLWIVALTMLAAL